MAEKQRCPKCNHPNELGAAQCSHCGAQLLQECPICGTKRPWYVPTCPRCENTTDSVTLFERLFSSDPQQVLDGRYRLTETLARGRVTKVYRATSGDAPEEQYAIKELSEISLIRGKEQREARSSLETAIWRWRQLSHPSLPRIIDLLHEHDRHYVVFEFAGNWSGARIISEAGIRTTPQLARNWGAQLCDLLAYLHEQDQPLYVPWLTPGNVVVGPDGRVRLVGLGLGRFFSPNRYGPYGSTHGYAAPELERGFPSVASDVFALGRLLYALLIDRLLEKGLPRKMPLNREVPGISRQLVRTIASAANRDPAKRYASMRDLGDALWEKAYGPLEPDADWYHKALREQPKPAPTARPRHSPAADEGTSMADLGFARDPRYGQASEQPAEQPIAQPQPKLSVQPHQFRLGDIGPDQDKRFAIQVRNTGDAVLTARVISHVSWVTAPNKAVKLPGERSARIICTVHGDLVPAGHTVEPQALSVDSNAGRQWIGITSDVKAEPALVVENASIDFGDVEGKGQRRAQLIVRNAGRRTLSGQVRSKVDWLRLPTGQFRCEPDQRVGIPVDLLPAQLAPGSVTQEDAILLDSDGGQARIGVTAHRIQPILDLGGERIDFGVVASGDSAERYLYVGNTGNGQLTATVKSLLPWLQIVPEKVACAPGELVQVTITANAAGLSDGTLEVPEAIRVQSNGGGATLALRLQIVAPRLTVAPAYLDFGDIQYGETATATLFVGNSGSAGTVAKLTALAPWLSLSTDEVDCAPDSSTPVQVKVDSTPFEEGIALEREAALRVVAGTHLEQVGAKATILRPSLALEPEEIDFGYVDPAQPAVEELVVRNQGTGDLGWQILTDADWVEVEPGSGRCTPGSTSTVAVTAYALALETGVKSAEATLIINSDAGRSKVPLRLALASPRIATDTTLLDLGTSVNREDVQAQLRIFNHGLGVLRGTIRSDSMWLVPDRISFECPTGRSVQIRVSTDMEEFPEGSTDERASIYVQSNGGDVTIETIVEVALLPRIEAVEPIRLTRHEESGELRGRLVIENHGMAVGRVRLGVEHEGLSLSRKRCDVKPGKSARVSIRWQGVADGLPDGMGISLETDDQVREIAIVDDTNT